MEKLAVIIPVYNEEGAIGECLTNWVLELKKLNISFSILVFNDGSKDKSLTVIRQKAMEYAEINAIDQANQGHGPTILKGYITAVRQNFDWIFQIDSDNEMSEKNFSTLWQRRHEFDFLLGQRANRHSPWPRRVISFTSLMTVRLFYGAGVNDVNSPYRLMRASYFGPVFPTLDPLTFAPNVILSGIACFTKARIFQAPVEYQSRKTGTVSIKKLKLLKAALKSFRQTAEYIRLNKNFLRSYGR